MSESQQMEGYDYIVVGSGAGGAVVAARLSENPSCRVLLLEAGPEDNSPWVGMPLGFARVIADPKYMWLWQSKPEKILGNRELPLARGKILGGSTSVNGMIYLRGNPYDFNLWRQMGAEGWSYEEVLPFFKKSEKQSRGKDDFHGVDGPLNVEDGRWITPLSDAFIAGSESIGIPSNPDFNRDKTEGAGYFQLTTRRGRRVSTARSFLKEARGRKNLDIWTNTAVTHVEIEDRRAQAVCAVRDGVPIRVAVKQEIILACGGLGTPQLLERSGIGNAALLRTLGITVQQELNGVGENLMEHLLIKRSYTTNSPHTLNAMMSNRVSQTLAGLRYTLLRTGPLAAGPAPAGGLACTRPGLPAPDINFLFHPFEVDNFGTDLAKQSSFQISFFPTRPESRGHVHITSPDIESMPEVMPKFLDTPADMQTAVDGLRLIGRIGQAPPMAAHIVEALQPQLDTASDAELIDYIRDNASAAYHSSGTCRMGNDATAVVDHKLRVRGISGLRIADASIMPTMPSASLSATCMMIGEKCADMIARPTA